MIPPVCRRLTLQLLLVLSLLVFVAPAEAQKRTRFGGRHAAPREAIQFQALPLERSAQNHLMVRAYINGKPALLGVDTGAPVSAIAKHRASYYKMGPVPKSSELPSRLRINGSYNRVGIAKTVRLGGLNLIDEPLVVLDLGSSASAAAALQEDPIDGILGADVLFPTKSVIDCRKQLLVMKMDPDTPGNIPGFDYRGHRAIPMQVSRGWNLYVDSKINGRPARLLVDTGAFSTLLHQPLVRSMRIPMRTTAYTSAGVNLRRRDVHTAMIRRLSIGKVDLMSKEVAVMDLDGLIHTGMLKGKTPVAGLLGSEILERHHGIIDFGTQMLYLKR